MTDFTMPWRMKTFCVSQSHVQYCRTDDLMYLNSKLYRLLLQYGSTFDDEWFYWLTKNGRYAKRTLVDLPKSMIYEKARKYEPNRKLFE